MWASSIAVRIKGITREQARLRTLISGLCHMAACATAACSGLDFMHQLITSPRVMQSLCQLQGKGHFIAPDFAHTCAYVRAVAQLRAGLCLDRCRACVCMLARAGEDACCYVCTGGRPSRVCRRARVGCGRVAACVRWLVQLCPVRVHISAPIFKCADASATFVGRVSNPTCTMGRPENSW